DSRPETLRLLFATPRTWLDHGKRIRIERAPTAFGDLSLNVRSQLNEEKIGGEIRLPHFAPPQIFLRLRLPAGWQLVSAQVNDQRIKLADAETLDLSGKSGTLKFEAAV